MNEVINISHLDQVVSIHSICFPDSQSTKYGKRFLEGYNTGVWKSENSVSFVSILDGKVVGFVAGGVNKRTLSRQIVSSSKHIILASFIRNILRHPFITIKKYWSYARAYLLPNKSDTFYRDNTAVLDSIALLSEYRGKGIAEDLVSEFLEALRKKGVSACRLGVEAENTAARKFYEKLNFEQANEIGSIYIYYFDDQYRN